MSSPRCGSSAFRVYKCSTRRLLVRGFIEPGVVEQGALDAFLAVRHEPRVRVLLGEVTLPYLDCL